MKRFQVLTGILDEDVCAQACQDFLLCSNYTFFGPSNPLKWVKLYRTEGCPTWKMGIHFSFLMTTKRREAWMKKIIFFRFVCFLFSSCNDVSTDCEDCHVGVPQCQVIADQGRAVGKPVADSSKYSLWWRGGFSQVSTKRKFTELLFFRGIKYLPRTTNSSSKCMCATSETSLTGNARKQQPAHHWRQPQRL